ncbi:GRIP and coiled-coil domain-containing protein 2-like [Tribolium madens]|uniref:GRIP and coiled-coil domain-containing protein 2-like n=1 Tax=Tribolium madens TaxID=41895 RepID=UPI001CF72D3F|nr:GRIP and coiled-coil domain-containing protein 2-like [Tribolium madens]
MSNYLDEILKTLGWEDGFQIPVANAENQQLEAEVARLTLQKIKEKTAFETSTVKLENIENHLKYVKQESEQNQNLITAHAQQLQTEESKLRLSTAEKDKFEQDIKLCEKKFADIQERHSIKKNQLERYVKKLDKLKSETDWDSEALKAWEESLKKRDDDNELIKKFSKQDDRKYNELEARRQNLEVEFANRKQTIDKMVSDLINYERVLERTGKIMKQQVVERNALIQQWKESVNILHQRDNDIDRLQAQMLETQEIIEKEEEKLDEQKQFYENEVRNNNELEHEAQQLNLLNSRIRRELNEMSQNLFFLNSQADTLRRTMILAANQLEKERVLKKHAKEEIEKMEHKNSIFRAKLDVLKAKNEQVKKSTMSADERMKHLEKLIDYEQKQQKTLQLEAESLQNTYFRTQHDLQEQQSTGKMRDLEIYGMTTNINHLRKHNDDQKKALGKRKEDAYDLDYRIDEVQSKILINENVLHSDDTEELEGKLVELESKIAEHAEIKNLLKDQVNKIRDDMRRLTTAIVADQNQLSVLKDKLQHQHLNFEGGQKQLQVLKNSIQEKQVEENILRLRVNQLNKAMKKEENSIYTMKKFKLTLEQATQERMLEIETSKDILLAKRRNLSEDNGRLRCDIAERRIKLDQFKKKYDIILASLGKDEDGQPLSVTHFKIKNAQEKYFLQQEGDALDMKIKKAEKEILAMENTLKVVNLTNVAFKQSLGAVEDDGREMSEMKMLENQMLLINDILRENRKKMAVKRQELEEVQNVLKELEIKRDQAKDALFELEEEYLKTEKECTDKEEKLKRAEHCLKLAQKKVRRTEREKYDRDLEIRQLKDANVSAMQRLLEMSVRYQEMAPLITRYTLEYDVKLPEKRTLASLCNCSESSRSTPSYCNQEKDVSDVKSVKSESSSTKSSAISKVSIEMESNTPPESGKKVVLENLSKEELIKRCERLLILAQKAKQAKDALQEENTDLKSKLKSESGDATNVIIENLTQQKLHYVTTIEDLKNQNAILVNKLQNCTQDARLCEEKDRLESENISYKRQIKRLTDENEQLITHLESLEKQLEECKNLGLEQQNHLLMLEKSNRLLEDTNQKLQSDNTSDKSAELQKMLSISLEEVKKLQAENNSMTEKIEVLKTNLGEKDKNILIISQELQEKLKLVDNFEKIKNDYELREMKEVELEKIVEKLKERLKFYHSKIVKLASNVKVLKESKNDVLSLLKTYVNQVEEWKGQLNVASEKLCHEINNIKLQNSEYCNEIKILKETNAKYLKQLEAHKTDDEKSKELGEFERISKEYKKLIKENEKLLELQIDYQQTIETLTAEKESLIENLRQLEERHQEEIKVFDDQSKKDTIEIQNRIEENEKICIEYRKVISKLEEDLDLNLRELNDVKQKNYSLQEALEHSKETERQIADRTSDEILKLVQENAQLVEMNQKLQTTRDNSKQMECQTEDSTNNELEELVSTLKRENSELLAEMNEMNQALKERGETISKLQSHCEEVMKKLQLYETQANKNVDNISQKEEIIKKLEAEIERLKTNSDLNSNTSEISDLKNEIENLKERLNANLDSSYADSESMSTSTISRSEEANRMKDLEGSWEERYGKLRNLGVKLKGKVRDLSNELVKEQNEKNDIQQRCATNIKTIATLQAQCDKLQDELEENKKQIKDYSARLDSTLSEVSKDKQKLSENEEIITILKKELEELNQEKITTEVWKKQISGKVSTLRKELDANKVLKKEYEAKIAKLSADLEAKEQALKAESEYHQQTKNSLEHSNIERKKNSVLNLEMQDYERSVKELSQKLEKKQEEITKLKSQLESQKSTTNAVREQNKLLEERAEEMKTQVGTTQAEIVGYKKQISDLESVVSTKENKIHDLTQLLETVRSENEELSTELSKVIAEHQKVNASLKTEKENLKGQVLGLQQTLREVQDVLKLKEDELKIVQSDYENYKVRAQSVLRQNQNRDVGLEEKLSEEATALRVKCEALTTELNKCRTAIEDLKKENEVLIHEKLEISSKCEEVTSEVEDLKTLYDQLTNKHQQTVIEHSETVRSLKVHAETLAQCYRQQLSEQEVRHNREIIELQSKIEKAPSPELSLPPLPMHREEGEGSESTENTNKNPMHPVPLERLLGGDTDQEVAFLKKQLSEEESKVVHLTALLADTEQDLAKHAQMNKLLKEEIRRQQRSVEREKHAENLEYLKNVVFKFVTLHSGDERSRLVPVLNTILKLSPEETQKLNMVARGDPGIRGWTNYLPLWPSPSKP